MREETITIAGQAISCQVISATIGGSQHDPTPDPSQVTFWIEKDRGLVRKETVAEQVKYPLPLHPLREVKVETATYYTVVDRERYPNPILPASARSGKLLE